MNDTTKLMAVCWANDGDHMLVGSVADLGETDDAQLWHDHSARGGDIVCTGPFALTSLATVLR